MTGMTSSNIPATGAPFWTLPNIPVMVTFPVQAGDAFFYAFLTPVFDLAHCQAAMAGIGTVVVDITLGYS